MNSKAVQWVDQTLNTGVLHELKPDVLYSMGEILSGLGVNIFDIQLTAWQKYRQPLPNFSFAPNARCIAEPVQESVTEAYEAGFRRIVLVYTYQSWRGIPEDLAKSIVIARAKGMAVSLHIVNAPDLDQASWQSLFPLLEGLGLTSLIIGDRDSRLDPFRAADLIKEVLPSVTCALGLHAHNRYGLATANSLSAIRSGAREIAVAVAGIGNSGHAALEEVMIAGQRLLGFEVGVSTATAPDCASVLGFLGYSVPPGKAVIGSSIFSHESGIHVDGIVKDTRLYEAFPPEAVGLKRQVIIGKHSGTASLKTKFQEWGLALDDRCLKYLLKKVRKLAVSKKGPVGEPQLKRLYYRMTRRRGMRLPTQEA